MRTKECRSRQATGFTLSELLVSVACVLLLAVILLPALARSKARSSKVGCINNLKQVGIAFHLWSTDNQGKFPMRVPAANGGTLELIGNGTVFPHFQVLSNELAGPRDLVCPNDEKKSPAANFIVGFSDRNLSYFLGLDAAKEDGSSPLSGDRNLTNNTPFGGGVLLDVTPNLPLGWGKDLHSGKANLCFGDGSTKQVQNGFVVSGTNRFALP